MLEAPPTSWHQFTNAGETTVQYLIIEKKDQPATPVSQTVCPRGTFNQRLEFRRLYNLLRYRGLAARPPAVEARPIDIFFAIFAQRRSVTARVALPRVSASRYFFRRPSGLGLRLPDSWKGNAPPCTAPFEPRNRPRSKRLHDNNRRTRLHRWPKMRLQSRRREKISCALGFPCNLRASLVESLYAKSAGT
jgi:hypothetical protein